MHTTVGVEHDLDDAVPITQIDEDNATVIAAAIHPAAQHHFASRQMLEGFAPNRCPQQLQRLYEWYGYKARGIRLQGRYEVQHHATAINLVAAGVGAAILPSSTFEPGDRPGVRKIPLTHPVVRRQVVLLQRRDHALSPAAQAFHDLISRTRLKP